MKRRILLLALGAWSFGIFAAETGERTYADPACSERDADPEKCVIVDVPPTRAGVGEAAKPADLPKPEPEVVTDKALTPKGAPDPKKPAPVPTGDRALTAKPTPAPDAAPSPGKGFTPLPAKK